MNYFEGQLNIILEAGISRREFLRQSGGGLLGVLTGLGMPLKTAQTFASAAVSPKIFVNIPSLFFSYRTKTVGDELKDLIIDHNGLRRIVGRDAEIMTTTSNGEDFGVGAYITPEKFAQLLQSSDCSKGICDHEDLYYEDLRSKDGTIFDIHVDVEGSQGGWPDHVDNVQHNLIKSYWNAWAKHGATDAVKIDDRALQYLEKHGVDTTDRPPEEWELLRRYYIENPEHLGEPTRYGLSLDDPGIRQAYEKSQQSQEVEDYDVPPDYKLASPMHQPMESKNRRNLIIENERGFLDAIKENPADWNPKLQYADWLEERGDPLGLAIQIADNITNIVPRPPETYTLYQFREFARHTESQPQLQHVSAYFNMIEQTKEVRKFFDDHRIADLINKLHELIFAEHVYGRSDIGHGLELVLCYSCDFESDNQAMVNFTHKLSELSYMSFRTSAGRDDDMWDRFLESSITNVMEMAEYFEQQYDYFLPLDRKFNMLMVNWLRL